MNLQLPPNYSYFAVYLQKHYNYFLDAKLKNLT
jgi:hypothetical protein